MSDYRPPLTEKQAAFVRFRRLGHNKSEAARLAGYTPISAPNVGSALSRDPRIIQALRAEKAS